MVSISLKKIELAYIARFMQKEVDSDNVILDEFHVHCEDKLVRLSLRNGCEVPSDKEMLKLLRSEKHIFQTIDAERNKEVFGE